MLTIHSLHSLVPLLSIVVVLLQIYNIECDIFTLNNKYSSWETHQNIDFGDSHKEELNPNLPEVWERIKRDVSSEKNGALPIEPEVIMDRSVLNGTQATRRALVHWIGTQKTSEKVLVLTCSVDYKNGYRQVTESYLWSSDDYGTTFHKQSFGKDTMVSYFYTVPTDSKKLIFTDVSSKKVYTTSDELTSFQTNDVPVAPDIIIPHPFIEDAVLLYSLLHRHLYVSMDFAKTWTLLSENVLPTFFWASKDMKENPLLVHMEIEGSAPTQSLYKACIAPKCEIPDQENPLSVGPFIPKSLIVHKEFMLIQKLSSDGSSSYLMVSYQRKPFEKAHFPGNVMTSDFIILNLDDGQIFIGVNHGDKVNLYLSDETGHFFVLSLSNVNHQIIRPYYFGIDFLEVQGMNWTFIANLRKTDSVATVISFDKGGNWNALQVTEEMKKDCKLKSNCDLKILITDTVLGKSVVSNENAPGIIVAHGTIGTSNTTVFTSRDGGWTWKKAPFTGRYQFNILDQGSILSAIPAGLFHVSKMMYYSIDEGETWKKEIIDPNGLLVKGVLTEPSIMTLTELLFGYEMGPFEPWTLVKLNFSSILPRRCENDDYEYWFPKDYNSKTSSTCPLGRKQKFKRRKQAASCQNDEFIPRIKSKESCDCTSEDYECDFGYEENELGACVKAKWFFDGYLPLECAKGSTYLRSKGYRKVPADGCVEKEAEKKKYGKETVSCNVESPHGLSLTSHNSIIITGKEASFFLNQAGGSRTGTVYTWNLNDSSPVLNFNDYTNASHIVHIFTKSGHYNITVSAKNAKGMSKSVLSVHVQDRISSIFILAPKAGKVGQPVEVSIYVSSPEGILQKEKDRIHYVWTFGDEASSDLPTLSWTNSMSHTYKTALSYDISVEAVNSVNSLYRPLKIKIYETAIIMVMKFTDLNLGKEPKQVFVSLLLERLQQELLEDLGVNLNRIEVVLTEFTPVQAHLYIFPSTDPLERTSEDIKKSAVALVESGELGINLFGRRDDPGKIFKVVSIEPLNGPGKGHGPNMTPVYIAVPVLVIVLVTSFVLFFYCRRRIRNVRQYNLLNTHDDSDALLDDDDDEAPLDLDIDFGVREPSRDDNIMIG